MRSASSLSSSTYKLPQLWELALTGDGDGHMYTEQNEVELVNFG